MTIQQPRPNYSANTYPLGGISPIETVADNGSKKPSGTPERRNRHLGRRMAAILQVGAMGVFAYGLTTLPPSFSGTRIPIEERLIWPFIPADCEPGWTAQVVDPVNLSRAFREVSGPITEDYQEILSKNTPGESLSDAENARHQGIRNAHNDLSYLSNVGSVELLDETLEVACRSSDGSYIATIDARDALVDFHSAGYDINPISGEITRP